MALPERVELVTYKPKDIQLLGAAFVLLIIFASGVCIAIAQGNIADALMMTGIFGCLTVQGMRK